MGGSEYTVTVTERSVPREGRKGGFQSEVTLAIWKDDEQVACESRLVSQSWQLWSSKLCGSTVYKFLQKLGLERKLASEVANRATHVYIQFRRESRLFW